eukprot:m.103727 g.103727  ORF g.103727 m.103727 type:complete len:565 (-) comp8866_c0_seq1:1555-3249(-)
MQSCALDLLSEIRRAWAPSAAPRFHAQAARTSRCQTCTALPSMSAARCVPRRQQPGRCCGAQARAAALARRHRAGRPGQAGRALRSAVRDREGAYPPHEDGPLDDGDRVVVPAHDGVSHRDLTSRHLNRFLAGARITQAKLAERVGAPCIQAGIAACDGVLGAARDRHDNNAVHVQDLQARGAAVTLLLDNVTLAQATAGRSAPRDGVSVHHQRRMLHAAGNRREPLSRHVTHVADIGIVRRGAACRRRAGIRAKDLQRRVHSAIDCEGWGHAPRHVEIRVCQIQALLAAGGAQGEEDVDECLGNIAGRDVRIVDGVPKKPRRRHCQPPARVVVDGPDRGPPGIEVLGEVDEALDIEGAEQGRGVLDAACNCIRVRDEKLNRLGGRHASQDEAGIAVTHSINEAILEEKVSDIRGERRAAAVHRHVQGLGDHLPGIGCLKEQVQQPAPQQRKNRGAEGIVPAVVHKLAGRHQDIGRGHLRWRYHLRRLLFLLTQAVIRASRPLDRIRIFREKARLLCVAQHQKVREPLAVGCVHRGSRERLAQHGDDGGDQRQAAEARDHGSRR